MNIGEEFQIEQPFLLVPWWMSESELAIVQTELC